MGLISLADLSFPAAGLRLPDTCSRENRSQPQTHHQPGLQGTYLLSQLFGQLLPGPRRTLGHGLTLALLLSCLFLVTSSPPSFFAHHYRTYLPHIPFCCPASPFRHDSLASSHWLYHVGTFYRLRAEPSSKYSKMKTVCPDLGLAASGAHGTKSSPPVMEMRRGTQRPHLPLALTITRKEWVSSQLQDALPQCPLIQIGGGGASRAPQSHNSHQVWH